MLWLCENSAIYENFYGEIGIEALTDFEGDDDVRISDLYVINRYTNLDLKAGRQPYLKGPVNNTGLGSLFSEIYFDGVAVEAMVSDCNVMLAWLEEYEQWRSPPVESSGFFGRVDTVYDGGVFGLNLLEDDDGWGWSVDGSVPLVPGTLDLYLEVGQDTLDRPLVTAGAYFPEVYETSNIDLFVEFADREDYQNLLSAVAYWEADDGWTGIGSVRHLQESDMEFTLGIARRVGSLSR